MWLLIRFMVSPILIGTGSCHYDQALTFSPGMVPVGAMGALISLFHFSTTSSAIPSWAFLSSYAQPWNYFRFISYLLFMKIATKTYYPFVVYHCFSQSLCWILVQTLPACALEPGCAGLIWNSIIFHVREVLLPVIQLPARFLSRDRHCQT